MSRTSRIPHPRGGRFVQIHEWLVRIVGLAAAAVIGVLDFLDRGQELPGQPVVTRQRLIAELEGVISRNRVDEACAALVEMGWIKRTERTTMGERNIQRRIEFALDADAIGTFLVEAGIPGIPNQGNRESPVGDRQGEPINIGKELIKPTTTHNAAKSTFEVVVDFSLEELLEATALQLRVHGDILGAGLKDVIGDRYRSGRCNARDVSAVNDFRACKEAEKRLVELRQKPPAIDLLPVSAEDVLTKKTWRSA